MSSVEPGKASGPHAIAAAIERLREAGADLRRRHPRDVVDTLCLVLESFRNHATPSRVRLEAELPSATGFTPEVVHAGLDLALEGWTREALLQLAARELGPAGPYLVSGHQTTAVLLGGALPTPTLLALLAPLVLRSPVIAKTSQHDPVTARVFSYALAAADFGLGESLEVITFPGSDALRMQAFLATDCVVATGSDETIASLAARVRPPRRFVGYGHRVSVAALGPEALSGAALAEAARGLALDVSLWDQLGCLSPVSVFVTGSAPAVAEAIAAALSELAVRLPRGRVPREASVAFAHARGEAEMRAAAGQSVTVYGDASWTVVAEADARLRPAPLHRFLHVHPVSGENGLLKALLPLAPHLAGVALAGFGNATAALAAALAGLGASRICAPGRLQAPPLAWRHDGQPVLLPLARFTDIELG